ncbi:hypothetical protein AGMMS49921_10770 [Endomicrobiia bacterium]|nr:hypothetical protein AGMMS49921_10770 [Endomicrobiia bacterium]
MDMSNDERCYRQDFHWQDLRNTYYWQPERRVSIQYQQAQQTQQERFSRQLPKVLQLNPL